MKQRLHSLRLALSAPRLLPHLFLLHADAQSALIRADLAVWSERLNLGPLHSARKEALCFLTLMTFTPEFRNLFYLRCGAKSVLISWLCPRLPNLTIVCPSIGPGLFIQHGENTFVTAERIGANFWIGRHVVIGFSNETDVPSIGNNVKVYAGAKIIGKVSIGDGATIGLNTVITQDVMPHTTMLGVPGKVVWIAKPQATDVSK